MYTTTFRHPLTRLPPSNREVVPATSIRVNHNHNPHPKAHTVSSIAPQTISANYLLNPNHTPQAYTKPRRRHRRALHPTLIKPTKSPPQNPTLSLTRPPTTNPNSNNPSCHSTTASHPTACPYPAVQRAITAPSRARKRGQAGEKMRLRKVVGEVKLGRREVTGDGMMVLVLGEDGAIYLFRRRRRCSRGVRRRCCSNRSRSIDFDIFVRGEHVVGIWECRSEGKSGWPFRRSWIDEWIVVR